jgi:hypothetical protein
MPLNDVIKTNKFEYLGEAKEVETRLVLKQLDKYRRDYSADRYLAAQDWKDYYTSYLTTPYAKKVSLSRASRLVGDVNVNWRHQIKSPKAFEIVETLVTYFMGAFFPNERYFDLIPAEPIQDANYHQITEVNRLFVKDRLDLSQYKTQFEIFLRELCISGTSAIMFPWLENNVKWQVLSPFEFLLDPTSQHPNDANFIRHYSLSNVELHSYAKMGLFNLASKNELEQKKPLASEYTFDTDILATVQQMQGLSDQQAKRDAKHTVYEFWGDLHLEDCILRNIRASWVDGCLLNCDPNPYGFRPFQIGTYIRLSTSPYGIGALQPVASQLYYKDSITSRQADNIAVGSDTAFLVQQDGVNDPDDVYIAPGKKIFVTKPDAVVPLVTNANINVTMAELSVIDQTSDKAVGTGPYIAVGAGRQGERVTAEEVRAQRDVGGKRLTTIFDSLETQVFLPVLERFHYYLRKFYKGQDILDIQGVYVRVTERTVDFPMRVKALGAANVADKEYNLRQLLEWLSVVSQNPELAARVNWDNVIQQLTYQMVPFIAEQLWKQVEPPPEAPANPGDQALGDISEAAAFVGGEAGQRALQSSLYAGKLPQLAQTLP